MAKIALYTSWFCIYCMMARRLLKSKGVVFEEYRVNQNRELRKEMEQRSKRTKSQIYQGNPRATVLGRFFNRLSINPLATRS
ncbi:MAG: hypothetical protein BMS9Abin15_0920 [Gammaproteobacteria bacterium]|nr:MAG: hypothetical protein BMS9Abin15_0920 [Gammaproteobacteria bacterium]